MKIFSLQSKMGLVVWSVLLGTLIDIVLFILSGGTSVFVIPQQAQADCKIQAMLTTSLPIQLADFGFIFHYDIPNECGIIYQRLFSPNFFSFFVLPYSFILDLFSWSLVALVVLNLVKRFKHKNGK